MTFEELTTKLKKLAINYRDNNILEDEDVQKYSKELESGEKIQYYKDVEISESKHSKDITHSVYESDSEFLNNKLLNLSKIQIVYIKTINNLYLKSSEDGILSLESYDNLDKKIKWIIKMDGVNSNSIEIYDYNNKKIKVDLNKKIKCVDGISSRFSRWKIKKHNKYFVLESFKFKNHHIDASNISNLEYEIQETSKWVITPIQRAESKKTVSIDNPDEKELIKLEESFNMSLDKINNYNLTVSYLEEMILQLEQLNMEDYKQDDNNSNHSNNEYDTIQNKIQKEEINLENIEKIKKDIIEIMNTMKEKEKSVTKLTKSKKIYEKSLSKINLTTIPKIKMKIEHLKEQLNQMKENINIRTDYDNENPQQSKLDNYKNEKISKINLIIQEIKNSKKTEIEKLKPIKTKLAILYNNKRINLRNKESEYESSRLKSEIEISKYSENTNIDNDLDEKIDNIREKKEILNNNIEYLIENDKYLTTKKNMLLIFINLLCLVGTCVLISLFINIYTSINY